MSTLRYRHASLALTLLLVAGLSACDAELQDSPQAMSLTAREATEVLPEQAIAIGRIDLKSLATNPLTTPFGESGFFTRHLQGEAQARFEDFAAVTGLDPEADLSEVYGAIEQVDDAERVSFAVYGDFDRDGLKSYVDSRLGSELAQREYGGITIYESTDTHGGIAFAFASDDMVIAAAGAGSGIERMIDRLQGNGSSIADNKALMERVARAAAAGDVWAVALKPAELSAPAGSDSELGRLAVAIEAVGGAVDVQPAAIETRMQLYPSESVSADDLASLVKGAVAMARAQDGLDDNARSMLDDVDVSTERGYVSVMFSAPNTFFADLMK